MQQKKQKAQTKACRHCGKESRGKYAAKTHICNERDVERYSRERGLAEQRAGRN